MSYGKKPQRKGRKDKSRDYGNNLRARRRFLSGIYNVLFS
jgi:hypothetical protein